MEPERWEQIARLHRAVLELEESQRAAFLREACAGDEDLRREVESLLAYEKQGEGFLESPPLEMAARLLARQEEQQMLGTTFSHYQIEERIGAGGMGVVYKARDTRLGRSVAMKFVKSQFSGRGQREARTVAALNHPNICTLHDVGPNYLVMEFIEGPTLAERMAQGHIPLQEALAIARQIAEALEAAHEKGVVHRDLKPANIKFTAEGAVKVLDFGLAKAMEAGSAGNPEDSPTVTGPTQPGMILGTAGYMSPEQANAKPVDKRADIWSFGVVLWELLTGHRLFAGETVTQTLAAVLRGPIEFDRLPRETPAAIRYLLRRCLERDAKNRLRDIGEARIAIEAGFGPAEPAAPPPKPRSLFAWIAVAAVFALSFGALALVHFREAPPQRQRVKYQINPPGELENQKLSPDGRLLAFVTADASTSLKIWVRSLESLDTRLLTDVQGLINFDLFWSWDGEQIAFQSGNKLYKIARNGGPPVLLADAPQPISGGVWLDSGVILFGTASGLFRVSSSGGAPVKIDDQSAESPAWLPNRRFLYVRANGVFAGSLDGGKPVRILPDHAASTYVLPSRPGLPGHLIFVRGETLLAQAFNASKLELQGDAIPVEERLPSGGTAFTASVNGVLILGRRYSDDVVLTWLDRTGKRLRSVGKPFTQFSNPAIRLSPNDSQAILPIVGPTGTDLWIADLNRETRSRFTFNGSFSGVWSPDGKKVLWAANDGNRYLKSADGSGQDELLYTNPACKTCYPNDWSPDGKLIVISEIGKQAALDLWLVPVDGDRKPYPYLQSRFATYFGQISPDNRWMAYCTDQTPHPQQVFVESIPAGKGRWQISTEGGDNPYWGHDGKELFYRQGAKVMAVPIRLTETSVESGKPQPLFEIPPIARFQVSRDGQRFLIALPVEGASTSTPLTVDTDWRIGLAK
jgi:Tol biopolymer transport system component/predicted Ser/Thr protein kinase